MVADAASSNVEQFIDTKHAKVHAGLNYMLPDITTITTSGSFRDVLLQTSSTNNYWHLCAQLVGDKAGSYYLFESPTATAGAALTFRNNSRPSSLTTDIAASVATLVTAAGTTLAGFVLGSTGGSISFGGLSDTAGEIILNPNTKYLSRFVAGAATFTGSQNIQAYLGGKNT